MRKKLAVGIALLYSFCTLSPSPVFAQTQAWSARNARCTHFYEDVATIQGVECLLANVLATVMTIIGIAAFVMFLVGSFQFLTAGANTKNVESGKNAISYAIIGIVVALASFLILRFISTFTGVNTILQFNTQIEDIQ